MVSTINVVNGDTIDEPTGDFNTISAKTWPEEVSIVFSSVTTVNDISGLAPFMAKVPSLLVLVLGSPGLNSPSSS